MKLRYQMRGLGIGIIVTALLMGVVKGEKIPLSDAEIKVRAMELGMVESDSLRLSDIPKISSSPEAHPEPDMGSGDSERESAVPGGEGSDAPGGAGGEGTSGSDAGQGEEAGDVPADSVPAEADGQAGSSVADGSPVTVVIEEGVTSYSVCQLLEELGLIEDADSLDFYICSNSYSRSIQEGTYEIPKGTSEEEIVRIIMGKK